LLVPKIATTRQLTVATAGATQPCAAAAHAYSVPYGLGSGEIGAVSHQDRLVPVRALRSLSGSFAVARDKLVLAAHYVPMRPAGNGGDEARDENKWTKQMVRTA
jgi:hypothetical protein